MIKRAWLLIFTCLFAVHSHAQLNLDQLILPAGYKISYFAKEIKTARQLALSPNGTVFVGSFSAGEVHALKDVDGDGVADKKWLLAKELNRPTGIAFHQGDLYIAAIDKIYKLAQVEQQLNSPKLELFFDKLPDDVHHGWKYLTVSPTGELIIPVGAPCNVCEAPSALHNRILSMNLKTKTLSELAKGVRNTVGFDYHPVTEQLWFSENGRDHLGDDSPPCEINVLDKIGQHFGFPYFHGGPGHAGAVADPEFGQGKKATDYIAPAFNLGAHVAPLGIHFYRGKQFPAAKWQSLFVAEHGSWNRSKKAGYKVGRMFIKGSKVMSYEDFITGFMLDETTYGRPVDIIMQHDGSLLISDDFNHAIYKVSYRP